MADKKPVDILREAIMLLNTRKLPPTPENYQAIYHEIAGIPDLTPFPEENLLEIARALPAKNPEQQAHRQSFEQAIDQHDWSGMGNALAAYCGTDVPSPPMNAPAPLRALSIEFMEQLARLVENTLPALGNDDPRFIEQLTQLVAALRASSPEITALKTMLSNFNHRLSFVAEDQAEIRATLLKLLHHVFENIGELTLDDRWLKQHLDALILAAAPPLTLRRLDDLERRLKDVMFKQIEAKGRTLEAQEQMRSMLATFIERLSEVATSTGNYRAKIEQSAKSIEQAGNLQEIAPVLKDVVHASFEITEEVKKVRDELCTMREKTEAAEKEIAVLHEELDRASSQARHDALTGALNRKGLDEALVRELSNVQRKETPLCVVLMDIDDFKKLNDSKGHDAGDTALIHLTNVTRKSMREQDTLARYGGEEFVILMPDTLLEQGVAATTRLQRALSRRYLLVGGEKISLTFSAGVAQVAADESSDDAIKRADQAMYLAKRNGKNRVLSA